MLRLTFILLLPLAFGNPGGWKQVPLDDPSVTNAAAFATKELSRRTNSLYHSKLIKIVEAEKQIVAGVNFKITLGIGYTTCKKSQTKYDDIDTCDFQEGPHKTCTIKVYRNLKQEHKVTKFDCQTDPSVQASANTAHQVHAEKLLFDDFIARHEKIYKDDEEKQARFHIFQENLKKIKFLNDHERGTARYGTTKFADLSGLDEDQQWNQTGVCSSDSLYRQINLVPC